MTENQETDPTVDELFDSWLTGKVERGDLSYSSRDRYKRRYEQCFAEFGKKKIKSISEYDIEEFVLNSIAKYDLTAKAYSGIRTILFGVFRLAKKKRMVRFSITEVVNDMDIPMRRFRKIRKEDDELVFTQDEAPRVEEYLEKNQDVLNLGILLLFKAGLRIGELVALKREDIYDGVIADSLIINQMGHTDIQTTRDHYYKNRRNVEQIRDELDKVAEL